MCIRTLSELLFVYLSFKLFDVCVLIVKLNLFRGELRSGSGKEKATGEKAAARDCPTSAAWTKSVSSVGRNVTYVRLLTLSFSNY